MDFIGGALPNVMFLVGVMAIGIGLGIEFKIIEIKAELSRNGRMAAFAVGAVLIGLSLFLYLRPEQQADTPAAPAEAAAPASGPTQAPATTAPPAAAEAPAVAVAPTLAPTTPPAPDAAPVSAVDTDAAEAITELGRAVTTAADKGELDQGIAAKLQELIARLDGQLVTGNGGEAAKTHEELVYNIGDAVEDDKLSPKVGKELLKLARAIPLPR